MKYMPCLLLIAVLFFCTCPTILHAEPTGFGDDVDDVPVDGGACLLFIAGIVHVIRKHQRKY